MDLGLGAGQIHLYRSLANAAHSGVPLGRTLGVLTKASSGVSPETLRRVAAAVDTGAPLSTAMRAQPDAFPLWQVEFVAIGEATGRLDSAFLAVAKLLEDRRTFAMGLGSAAAYPVFIVHVAPFLLFGPKVVAEGLGAYLLSVAGFLACFWLPAGGLAWAASEGLLPRRRIPVAGPLLLKMHFCSFLAAMLKAAVPVRRALEVSASAAGVSAPAAPAQPGETLLDSIRRYGVFSDEELARIEVAELSGKVDEDLQLMSAELAEKLQATLKTAAAVLPAVFYLAVALFIGYRIVGSFQTTQSAINQALGL